MKRKHLLYKSKVEYMNGDGVYTMNHVLGCSHGCKYCYAFRMAKRFGQVENYDDWCHPEIVDNTLELLEDELSRKRKEPVKRVFMSFMTDPFPYYTNGDWDTQYDIVNLSCESIELINSHGIPVTTLTKGITPKRIIGMHPENEFGTTFTTFDLTDTGKWEPGAAEPYVRFDTLFKLANAGEKTWLSIEPFGLIHPWEGEPHSQLERILDLFPFVNRIVFGKANYIPQAYKNPAWYRECAQIVRDFCEQNDIECIIKKGTIDA